MKNYNQSTKANNDITFSVYNPQCCANPSDNFLTEIRNKGWLIDRRKFNIEADAISWGENYNETEIQSTVSNEYATMIKRWANK